LAHLKLEVKLLNSDINNSKRAVENMTSIPRLCIERNKTSSSAMAERPRCMVGYGQKWKSETERQYFTDIIGLCLTTMT